MSRLGSRLLAIVLLAMAVLAVAGSSGAAADGATLVGSVETTSGTAPVVVADLFAANGDGSRARYDHSVLTDQGGQFTFSVETGCHVVVIIAPDGASFRNGSPWHEWAGCVEPGGVVTLDPAVVADGDRGSDVTIGDGVRYADGSPAPGVTVDLFAANADGSRAAFLGDTTTGGDGGYRFITAPGCYVVVFTAPGQASFVGGSRYHQTGACLAAGGSTDRIDAVLAGPDDPAPTPAPAFGFSPGGWFADEPDDRLLRDLDRMAEAGATWIRIDFDWSEIERNRGTHHWHRTDRIVDAARARGLNVIGLITESPHWARPSGLSSKAPPRDAADYAAFSAAAVERYGPRGVTTWELWNEPNLGMFWQPGPDPAAYVRLVEPTAAAMRSIDPSITILSGGLAPAADEPDGSGLSPMTFTSRVLDQAGPDVFDAYAIHPFSYPAMPMDPESAEWNPFYNLPRMHDLLVARGQGHKKIWLTEYGAPTGTSHRAVSEADQSAQIMEAIQVASDWSWTGPILLYSHRDERPAPGDFQANFGLFRNDGSPKQSWHDLLAFTASR